jgi:hypothetical protein
MSTMQTRSGRRRAPLRARSPPGDGGNAVESSTEIASKLIGTIILRGRNPHAKLHITPLRDRKERLFTERA